MKRLLTSLVLTVPFFIGCPGGESSDDGAAALLLLGAGETAQATCSLVSGHGTTVMPLLRLSGTSSVTIPTVADNHGHWAAVAIPSAENGTAVTFSFDPKYTPGGPSMLFVYLAGGCPIDADGQNGDDTEDDTAMSIAGYAAANYSWNNGTFTLTVNATGAGKNLIIVAAPTADPTGGTVTRTDP